MVKMYLYKYTGATTSLLTNGKTYVGRVSKSGETMAKCDKGYWIVVDSRRLTVCRLKKHMEVLSSFYVDNHKEAINWNGMED